MAMVGIDSGSLYRRTHSLSRQAWSWVGGRLAPFYIHQMNRELSQWQHHKHCLGIIITIIIYYYYWSALFTIYTVLHRVIWSLYIGRWWVDCYILYSEEGNGRGLSPPRPLLAVPNATAHPSTASVPITVLLYNGPLLCCFDIPVKWLTAKYVVLADVGSLCVRPSVVRPVVISRKLSKIDP